MVARDSRDSRDPLDGWAEEVESAAAASFPSENLLSFHLRTEDSSPKSDFMFCTLELREHLSGLVAALHVPCSPTVSSPHPRSSFGTGELCFAACKNLINSPTKLNAKAGQTVGYKYKPHINLWPPCYCNWAPTYAWDLWLVLCPASIKLLFWSHSWLISSHWGILDNETDTSINGSF